MTHLSSKARTLAHLSDKLTLFQIPRLEWFSVADYNVNPSLCIAKLSLAFAGKQVAVRSSASDEDGKNAANAGAYTSVLHVSADNQMQLSHAIAQVIASYSKGKECSSNDEVLVQEMVANVSLSGVIFTHDLNTGAPYYVINYDDESGLTNTVTSGAGQYSNRTLYIHRDSVPLLRSERFQSLMKAVIELENIMQSNCLDIEFALGNDFTPYLFQVRPITTKNFWNTDLQSRVNESLQGVQKFVGSRFKSQKGVFGKTTVLGQMPDWNPAEMIGRTPNALAYSLYKKLITDHAWRQARKTMGYHVPAGQPLMVSLAGQPFIDVRNSFHSFLPASLPSEICEKIVNAAIERLKTFPELHDKVEFSVMITAFSFDIDKKMEQLFSDVLDEEEKKIWKSCLHSQLKNLILDEHPGSIGAALKEIELLVKRQNSVHQNASLFELIEDCVNLGTTPFSVLARHGFIAKTLLLSLVERGVLSYNDLHQIQSGIQTIAGELVYDMHQLQIGQLTRKDFMVRYGHLRPGTYDILSLRYDQIENFGMTEIKNSALQMQPVAFSISDQKKMQISRLLQEEGFTTFDCDLFLEYIRAATVGREYGKFVFTRTVSDLLEAIALWGEQFNLSRDELLHIPIDEILRTLTESITDITQYLKQCAVSNAKIHETSVAIRLPQLLFDEAGVHIVPFQVSQPNFITQKKVNAECVRVSADSSDYVLANKIVLIENADPGFDWIFAHSIAGLITKYGGANSHMAIRCAEFAIPAAIGCGEQRFETYLKADKLLLDCAAGVIELIHG